MDDGHPFLEIAACKHTALPIDRLREAELRQAKTLYCAALEQHRLAQHILNQSRTAYQHAQQKWENLAWETSLPSIPHD